MVFPKVSAKRPLTFQSKFQLPKTTRLNNFILHQLWHFDRQHPAQSATPCGLNFDLYWTTSQSLKPWKFITEMDTIFVKDWDTYYIQPKETNRLVNFTAFQRRKDMDVHHWNTFWEDSGMLVNFANLSCILFQHPTVLVLKLSCRWSLTQQFNFSLFILDLKKRQIPSYSKEAIPSF